MLYKLLNIYKGRNTNYAICYYYRLKEHTLIHHENNTK